jgi:hypothetical protein
MTRQDRIAEPWGTRTPYAPGEEWPARVDCYLADGVTEADVEHWVPSASILHSNGDAADRKADRKADRELLRSAFPPR